MGGRCAVAAALAIWAGMSAGRGLSNLSCGIAIVCALALGSIARRAPPRTGTAMLLMALALGGIARGGAHRLLLDRSRALLVARDDLYRAELEVAEPALDPTGESVVVAVVRAAEPALLAGSRVRLRLPEGTRVEWGDAIEAFARLEAPPALRNPGGYDARAAADASDVVASGRAFTLRVLGGGGLRIWPRITVARWRAAIASCLDSHLDAPTRELVVPLVLGDRSLVTPDLNARLRASGLIHLLALSGLHVTWLAGIARGIVAMLGGGPRARAAAGALCALFYAGVAGPLPSLMRAAASELFAAMARWNGRALDAVQALALAAISLLVIAPAWAGDLGFQLSCAATLGLVTIGPGLDACWPRIARAVTPTLSAQVTALPLLIQRFHALPSVAPLSNLAAVPVSGLLLAAAWLGVTLEFLIPGSGRWCFDACAVLSAWLRGIAEATAAIPGSLVGAGSEPGIPLLAGAGAALLALSVAPPRIRAATSRGSPARFGAIAAGSTASSLAVALAVTAPPLHPPPGHAWLVVLDAGQGDAIALGFADGWWLVDAGARSARFDVGQSVVLPFFRWAGVRRLRCLLLTHDDGDHVGGASEVLRGLAVEHLRAPPPLPGVPGPSRRFPAAAAERGDSLRGEPLVRVLWPPGPAEAPPVPIRSNNASSLVVEVGSGRGRIALLADVDSTVEAGLDLAPGVAVLKVAHHGSRSSSGIRFVKWIAPRYAVISCGRRNLFGHPDPQVIERLRAAGAQVHRTDEEGALWFETSAEGVLQLDWRRGACTRPVTLARAGSCLESISAPRCP